MPSATPRAGGLVGLADHASEHGPLDLTEPIGLIMTALLHLIPGLDGPPTSSLTWPALSHPAASWSLSHMTADFSKDVSAAADAYNELAPTRSRA